jgi:hypothetical protein
MSLQAILSLGVCSLDLANDLGSKLGQVARESHRQTHEIGGLSDKDCHSFDWAAAFHYQAVRSQPVGLGGSFVLHNRFTFVIQPILCVGTRRKRQVEPLIHSINKRFEGWKNSRNDFSDIEWVWLLWNDDPGGGI